MTSAPDLAIEVSEVSQTYPGVQALRDVSLSVAAGEVIGLVGHNGAGKSTLTRIIGGVERAASGRLLVRGEEADFHDPQDALTAGISVVPQALSIVPTLTVRENIALGTRVRRGSLRTREGSLSKAELEESLGAVAAQLGIKKELRRKAGHCSPSVQRLVMIGRALLRRPAVMLLDEPTAALHPEEAERTFQAVNALRAEGKAIVFISHRLEEVLRVTSRVVVMRQGRIVAEAACADLTKAQLAELIAGRELEEDGPGASSRQESQNAADVILRCERLSVAPTVQQVSLEVARGEVVGLAGLEGSGCTDVLRAIAGLERPAAGSLTLNGEALKHSRRAAIESGVAYLPGDRVHNGIVPEMTVAATVTLSNDRQFRLGRWFPVLRLRREAQTVERLLDDLDVHPRGAARKRIKFLSGGNQQKALMARALIAGAHVYLLDQPTEGVDVAARQELHRHVRSLAERGGAVVVTSSEPDELVSLCDRVLVMHDGRVVRELKDGQISESEIVHASLVG